MSNQKIEGWIKTKLEEGVDRQRLRKVLEKKGYDPEIVEELSEDKDKLAESRDQQSSKHSTSDLHQSLGEKTGSEENTIELGKHQDKDKPDKSVTKQSSGNSEDEDSKVSKEAEHLEEIAGNLKKDVESKWKPGLEVVIVLVLLGSIVLFLPSIVDSSENTINQLEEVIDDLRQDQKPQVQSSTKESDSTSVSDVEVVLGTSAQPSELEISSNQNAKFTNQAGNKLELRFERNIDSFTLNKGESKTVDINTNVYYTAKNLESKNEIYGSVNVQ